MEGLVTHYLQTPALMYGMVHSKKNVRFCNLFFNFPKEINLLFFTCYEEDLVKQNSLYNNRAFLTKFHCPRHVYRLWPIGLWLSQTIG